MDYRDVAIPKGAVAYCDIPYKNTDSYSKEGFDHEAFYEWLRQQTEIVIVSEYTQPPDTVCIARIEKNVLLSAKDNAKKATEGLFVPMHLYDKYKEACEYQTCLNL